MTLSPDFDTFSTLYEAGAPQVVWSRLIDDLETPVSAFLKIAKGQPFSFLFESVEGGAWRGRYSIIAMKPDLIWQCRGDRVEICEGASDLEARHFRASEQPALESLRDHVAPCRICQRLCRLRPLVCLA